MICYINRSTVDYDVRLQKYVQACLETDTPYCVVAWDRTRNCSKVYPNEYQYKAYAPYGEGLKNVISLIGWVFYVWIMLVRKRKEYQIIHACNLENCILAYPFRLLGKRIVLDIYDSVNTKREAQIAKKIDALILPSNHRLKQVGITKDCVKHYLEVENVPIFHSNIYQKETVDFPQNIHLAYVGVLQRNIRGLENVLDIVFHDERFVLDIAGTGAAMDAEIKELADKCPRINYYGKVDYQQALQIMSEADFIVALYYLAAKVHEYASPNKYYESLYLGKPIITSKGTLVGNNVIQNDTGYVVSDTKEEFIHLFDSISTLDFRQGYMRKKDNCLRLWKHVYSSYFDKITKGEYIQLMRTIVKA